MGDMRSGDGGCAFPHTENDVGGETSYVDPGMSLRDWFAGQALAGLLAHASGEDPHRAPGLAYKLADDMLAERALPDTPEGGA